MVKDGRTGASGSEARMLVHGCEVQERHHLRLTREMGHLSHCPPGVSMGPMQTLARQPKNLGNTSDDLGEAPET